MPNIKDLAAQAFTHLNAPDTNTDRVQIDKLNPYKNVTIYTYAYKNLCGKGNEIDLMLEIANGLSYFPIRYDNGRIAYDIPISQKTLAATRRAYDKLRKAGLCAHSDYFELPAK